MNACDPLFRATPPLGTRLQLGATAKEEEAVRAQLAHLLGRAINMWRRRFVVVVVVGEEGEI